MEDQTTEHVLQICNRHQPERIAQWPSAAPLHQTLYGGLDDLKKTTNFITAAGLLVLGEREEEEEEEEFVICQYFLRFNVTSVSYCQGIVRRGDDSRC